MIKIQRIVATISAEKKISETCRGVLNHRRKFKAFLSYDPSMKKIQELAENLSNSDQSFSSLSTEKKSKAS